MKDKANGVLVGLRSWAVNLPRWPKRVILVLNDFALLCAALWLPLSVRLNTLYTPPDWPFGLLLASAPVIGILTFHQLGLYRLVTRYIGHQGTVRIFIAVAIAVLIWALVVLLSGITGVPRSVVLGYGILASFFIWASRQFAGWILKAVPDVTPATFEPAAKKVLIYGAGTTGVQLLQALQRGREYKPVGFVDDDTSLWGQVVSGVKVYRPAKLAKLIQRDQVREVFIAMPEASRRERRRVINRLQHHPVLVKILPAMTDIAAGRVQISDLRPVDADDLLGRDPVPPDPELLAGTIRGKSVLVTGAGGSIGSELARQILRIGPARLILLERSEVALYEIEMELAELMNKEAGRQGRPAPAPVPIHTVLGSILDEAIVARTLAQYGVETVYHAAAYKHVPIVEMNPVAGLTNNTFGTLRLARLAREAGVERFVLISTDKAVRPTNIMGASKRLAELILQAHAADPTCPTIFTMVRFGNVLDSSGSVIRRFRKQIEAGGPVTVTHPDIIRYFMSIPEAAELVIQAGALAEGGDVFVLDMGKPVKIADLARSMIRLMGLEVRDEAHPDGDIAIDYVGLRQGEKLYEELLIGENTSGTAHERILRSQERFLAPDELMDALDTLQAAMAENDIKTIHETLRRTVEGYTPDTRPVGPHALGAEDWPHVSRTLH